MKFDNKVIHVIQYNIRKTVNFIEYVFGGCEINLNIAIDFTLSNGKIEDYHSLHSLNNPSKNEYIKAIKAVGEILQYYDADKAIPLYGFGGVVPPMKEKVSHCFALNGDIFNPECNGITGIIESYKKAVESCELSGPTYFEEIIEAINGRAEAMEISELN